ncbi:MAG: Rrf2 family transcriptional regulator [Treponema sp.]|nr:Rrf2 family transcriptional regulator [Treponema sp.]
MMISTRGRYALRVLVDIAEHQNVEGYLALSGIAERQGISKKYMESIMTMLSKAGFVDAVHGKGGGYRLNRSPKEYTVLDILNVTEGSLAPVACLSDEDFDCDRKIECRTLPLWEGLFNVVSEYLKKYTLADLMKL